MGCNTHLSIDVEFSLQRLEHVCKHLFLPNFVKMHPYTKETIITELSAYHRLIFYLFTIT